MPRPGLHGVRGIVALELSGHADLAANVVGGHRQGPKVALGVRRDHDDLEVALAQRADADILGLDHVAASASTCLTELSTGALSLNVRPR